MLYLILYVSLAFLGNYQLIDRPGMRPPQGIYKPPGGEAEEKEEAAPEEEEEKEPVIPEPAKPETPWERGLRQAKEVVRCYVLFCLHGMLLCQDLPDREQSFYEQIICKRSPFHGDYGLQAQIFWFRICNALYFGFQ